MSKMTKQLEFDFMKPEWEVMLDKLDDKDLNELMDYIQKVTKAETPYSLLGPAYNPCSSCPNNGKGPCHCTLPNIHNGPIY